MFGNDNIGQYISSQQSPIQNGQSPSNPLNFTNYTQQNFGLGFGLNGLTSPTNNNMHLMPMQNGNLLPKSPMSNNNNSNIFYNQNNMCGSLNNSFNLNNSLNVTPSSALNNNNNMNI